MNKKEISIIPHRKKIISPFQKKILGVNLEITRTGFFGGLSAQMLNNRKLYMGETSVDGWEAENFERITDRIEDSLCLSNYIILKKGGSMRQTSEVIQLKSGEEYEAKVWIKALSKNANITFGVENIKKTFLVNADEKQYCALSFTFKGEDISNGSFFIEASDNIKVFQASLMPVNNFYGMRPDVIEKLKKISPTSIRFPGGCAADHFDWKESLKAPQFRKPADGLSKSAFLFRDTFNQDTLDIGINEFMMLCKELNSEPEYTISLVLSDGEDVKNIVEYFNGDVTTKYGAIRQSLGFDAFNVHLWYVGNEAFYFGGKFRDDTLLAAERTEELISAIKEKDNQAKVVIGVHWRPLCQKWSIDFINKLKCDYDYVSFHDYTGDLTDETLGNKGKQTKEMLEDNFLDGTNFGLEFYRNELFNGSLENVRICVDEWNYSWGKKTTTALFFSNAIQLHFLAKSNMKYHIDRAAFFMPVNEGMISVKGAECKMEATGEMFRLFANHKGGKVIECETDYNILDVLCTDHGDFLFLSVVNRRSEDVLINIDGFTEADEIKTDEYGFESCNYELLKTRVPVIHGHSMMFFTVKK